MRDRCYWCESEMKTGYSPGMIAVSQSLRSEKNLDYIECFTTKKDAAISTMDAHRQGWQEELKDGECSGY